MVSYRCIHPIYKWNILNIKLLFPRTNKKVLFREPHLKYFIRVTALLTLYFSAQQKRCKHSVNKFFFRFLNLAKKSLSKHKKGKKKIMFFYPPDTLCVLQHAFYFEFPYFSHVHAAKSLLYLYVYPFHLSGIPLQRIAVAAQRQ